MSLTNMTCYYYVIFIAFAAVVRVRRSVAPAMLATAASSQILLNHFYWIDDRYTALSYLFFAFALVPLLVMSRPLTKANLSEFFTSLRRHKRPGKAPLEAEQLELPPSPASDGG
jgi:ABC-type transport system involved in cytochrome c biogenesis permease subunit